MWKSVNENLLTHRNNSVFSYILFESHLAFLQNIFFSDTDIITYKVYFYFEHIRFIITKITNYFQLSDRFIFARKRASVTVMPYLFSQSVEA